MLDSVAHVGLNRYEATFCSLYLTPRALPAAPAGPETRLVEVLVTTSSRRARGTYLPTFEDPLLPIA